jgi:hypothetical protein
MDLAIRTTLQLWDRPVFEDANTGQTFADYRRLVLAGRQEMLVYRDAASQAQWKSCGADPALEGTMIYLIARDGQLTIAVDDIPNPSIRSYVEAVRSGLRNDLFASSAERRKKKVAA